MLTCREVNGDPFFCLNKPFLKCSPKEEVIVISLWVNELMSLRRATVAQHDTGCSYPPALLWKPSAKKGNEDTVPSVYMLLAWSFTVQELAQSPAWESRAAQGDAQYQTGKVRHSNHIRGAFWNQGGDLLLIGVNVKVCITSARQYGHNPHFAHVEVTFFRLKGNMWLCCTLYMSLA